MTFFKALAWGFGLMLGALLAYGLAIAFGAALFFAAIEASREQPKAPHSQGRVR